MSALLAPQKRTLHVAQCFKIAALFWRMRSLEALGNVSVNPEATHKFLWPIKVNPVFFAPLGLQKWNIQPQCLGCPLIDCVKQMVGWLNRAVRHVSVRKVGSTVCTVLAFHISPGVKYPANATWTIVESNSKFCTVLNDQFAIRHALILHPFALELTKILPTFHGGLKYRWSQQECDQTYWL